jgi:hypothetical protein
MRATTIGTTKPLPGQIFTSSDVKQTTPAVVANPAYLASPGIQIGPGTDLVTKSAGGQGFSTYVYPTIVYYGLKGTIKNGTNAGTIGYMWPGTQAVTNNVFPDPTVNPKAFFRIQQPSILSGMSVSLGVAVGTGSNTFQVYVTPIATGITVPITAYVLTFTDAETNKSYYNTSYDFAPGDLLHVGLTWTNNANNSLDATVQIDLF